MPEKPDAHERIRRAIVQAAMRLGSGWRTAVDIAAAACEEIILDDYRDAPAARARRDEAIRAEFNGRNGAALCKKHGISRATFYRAVYRRD